MKGAEDAKLRLINSNNSLLYVSEKLIENYSYYSYVKIRKFFGLFILLISISKSL